MVQAQGRLKDGTVYIDLYDVQMAGVQKRAAQLGIISSGFKVLAQQQVDLSSAQPLTITTAITEELEAFIDKYMAAFEIPGAAVGIVQNGQLVYAKGFGEANPETGAPMTPDTRMMIGSTGKSLTTMMMATLVDDGLMSWDTPVVELYPSFKVKDPELTKTITMRNLVCACTGVPRRDMEWLFNSNHLTPKDTVAALADFEFYTKFGEAFQYSNQMVATAGYIAGQVAEGNHGDLAGDYAKALQEPCAGPDRHDFDHAVIPAGRSGRQLCDSAHGDAGPHLCADFTRRGTVPAVDRAGRRPLVDAERHGTLHDHAARGRRGAGRQAGRLGREPQRHAQAADRHQRQRQLWPGLDGHQLPRPAGAHPCRQYAGLYI